MVPFMYKSSQLSRQPVYGLIFLFQYTPNVNEGEGEDETGSLWFANQVKIPPVSYIHLFFWPSAY